MADHGRWIQHMGTDMLHSAARTQDGGTDVAYRHDGSAVRGYGRLLLSGLLSSLLT